MADFWGAKMNTNMGPSAVIVFNIFYEILASNTYFTAQLLDSIKTTFT